MFWGRFNIGVKILKNIVIAFSGKAQSGKTTASECLKNIIESTNDVHYMKLSFAAPLKEIARYYFGWDGDKEIHYSAIDSSSSKYSIGHNAAIYYQEPKIIQDKGRQLLINIGEKFREIRPSIWADIVVQQIKDMDIGKPTNVIYCIDDLRFKNEIMSLNSYGRTYFIRINRSAGQLSIDDATERDLDTEKFDHYIENDGTISDLNQKIHQIYTSIIGKNNQ